MMQSPAGCAFVQVLNSHYIPPEPGGGCFVMIVSNPNETAVALRLRRGATDVDAAPFARLVAIGGTATYQPLPSGVLPARATAIVSTVHLPNGPNLPDPDDYSLDCPGPAFLEAPPSSGLMGTVGERSRGIELLADAPVLVTSKHMFQSEVAHARNGASLSAWPVHQLPPVHLWDETTVETGRFKPGSPGHYENPDISTGDTTHWTLHGYWLHGRTSVVASAPDTTVSFEELDGSVTTLTLDRGEFFTHLTEDAFVGKAVSADRPIALVSSMMAFAPWDYPFGAEPDSGGAVSMSTSRRAWGWEYVAVAHADRWPNLHEQPPWRIIGDADGTVLSYEPYRPSGAPEQINRGELVIFEAGEPFVVRSQDDAHVFFLGGHMTGGRYALQRGGRYPNEASRGGGVSTTAVPVARWAKRYPFFALLDWPEQSLVVVRHRGGKDVVLDCAGVIGGWQPAGTNFEYAFVPMTDPNYEPIAYGPSTCRVGPHWIESDEPFHATLWGLSSVTKRIEFFDDGSVTSWASSAYALPLLGDTLPPVPPGSIIGAIR